jgi:hypothetical protein
MQVYCGKKTTQVKQSNKSSKTKSGNVRKSNKAHSRTYCYSSLESGDDSQDCFIGKSERCVRKGKTPEETKKMEDRRQKRREKKSARGGSRKRSSRNSRRAMRGGEAGRKTPCPTDENGHLRNESNCKKPCTWAKGASRSFCTGRSLPPNITSQEQLAEAMRQYESGRPSQPTRQEARPSNPEAPRAFSGQKMTAEQRRSSDRNAQYKDYAGACHNFRTESDCDRDTDNCKWYKGYTRKNGTKVDGSCHARSNNITYEQTQYCDDIDNMEACTSSDVCRWDNKKCKPFDNSVFRGPLRQ